MKNSGYRFTLVLMLFALFSMAADGQEKGSSSERERERSREQYIVQEKMAQMEKQRAKEAEKLDRFKADKFGNYVYTTPESGFFFVGNGGAQSSQLSLSKSFSGESTKNEGSFEVDENVSYISFTINGSVKEGKIRINITLPGGEKLKEMTIDNTADIQFNQMIRPRAEEKKYSGKWTYEIEAVKAVGNYRLSLQTK